MCVYFVNTIFCCSYSLVSQKLCFEDLKLICPEIFPSGAGWPKKLRSRQCCKQGVATCPLILELGSSCHNSRGCFHMCRSHKATVQARLCKQLVETWNGKCTKGSRGAGCLSLAQLLSAYIGRKDCMVCTDTKGYKMLLA